MSSESKTLPNFLIIGAPSCGTTSLYHYLEQHPQVFMSSQKETRFFAYEGQEPDFKGPHDKRFVVVTDIETYHGRFNGYSNELAVGEASTNYLYHANALSRIHHHIPKAKLIVMLRNPVERAYANYLKAKKFGETMSFADALKAEPERIAKNWAWFWHYKSKGFYYEQLKRYYEVFNESQIKVIFFEDYKNEPHRVVKEIFNFIRVDESFIPDMSVHHNPATYPINQELHDRLEIEHADSTHPSKTGELSTLLRANLTTKRPPLDPSIRKALIDDYREDILKLQDLTERDLSGWIEPKPVLRGIEYHILGDDYLNGRNGRVKDAEKAFENWSLGAELGHLQCMKNLAWAYLHGIGTKANALKSGHWQNIVKKAEEK